VLVIGSKDSVDISLSHISASAMIRRNYPGLTIVPYGDFSPGMIATVERIPVALVSRLMLAD